MAETDGTIVILESDEALALALAKCIGEETGLSPCTATTAIEAASLIHDHAGAVFAAVVGVETKGANTMLQSLEENFIPSVAYGRKMTSEIRKKLSTLSIVDTVLATEDVIPVNVSKAVARLQKNSDIAILVAEDSRSMMAAISRYLTTRRYTVLMARDGLEALNLLAEHPEVMLVITDNEMPHMNGYALVREIRKTHTKDELAVIGISAMNNSRLTVNFINEGANDFLKKPFVKEELYCRVDHNIDMLERIALIRDLSNKDPLTRLYNRRYFYDNSEEFIARAEQDGKSVAVAMLDIDFFKRFNDTYGHDMGDAVLVHVSSLISEAFSDKAIVSRFGGEEFCILAAHDSSEDVFACYDILRRTIESSVVKKDGETVNVTISIGVCVEPGTLAFMLNKADANLYVSKKSGRNQVTHS